jgi:hypothetical protein
MVIYTMNVLSYPKDGGVMKYFSTQTPGQRRWAPATEEDLLGWLGRCPQAGLLFPVLQVFLTAVQDRTFDLTVYTAYELVELFPLNKTFHKFKYPDGLSQPSSPTRHHVNMFLISF